MQVTKRRIAVLAGGVAACAIAAWAFVPKPLEVEVARVTKGPLTIAVEEDGVTRVRERYDLAAPVTGRLRRIELHAGDPVRAGQPLATMEPSPLDPKQEAQLTARLEAALRARAEADANAARARSAYAQAQRDDQRVQSLKREGVAAIEQADKSASAERIAARELEAARFRAQVAAYDVEVARAALNASGRDVVLRSPVDGRVLRVLQESESVVTPGAKIMELGDPHQVEIVIDTLSADAVKVHPGDRVLLAGWGGEKPLEGHVRVVEPSGFMKVSALGVEEQRVNVIADFADPPPALGDQYRVEAKIVVWQGTALKVPATALFSSEHGWSVFVVDGRRARLRKIVLGHLGTDEGEVVSGLADGERVVLHPSDQLRDGLAVKVR